MVVAGGDARWMRELQNRGVSENGGAAVKMEVVVVAAPWCSAREDGRDGCCNGGRRGELRERWRWLVAAMAAGASRWPKEVRGCGDGCHGGGRREEN